VPAALSGKALFGRTCRVTLRRDTEKIAARTSTTDTVETTRSDVVIEEHRIQFEVKKNLYNLSDTTRAELSEDKKFKVIVEAGYQSTGLTRYLIGDVRTVDHMRESADWITRIRFGDGERAWRHAKISESWSPGVRTADVVERIARAMGVDLGNVKDKLSRSQRHAASRLDHGWCASGSASREFDRIMKACGLQWTVIDGELFVWNTSAVHNAPYPDITPQTGLIDSPEFGTPPKKKKKTKTKSKAKKRLQTIKLKSLLVPTRPGAKVRIKSERFDGHATVQVCKFVGDTHGRDWYTEIEAISYVEDDED
jgi:hypothetical protein